MDQPRAAWIEAYGRLWNKIGGGWLLLSCVFFALYFFYVLRIIDPRIVYDAHGLKLPSGETFAFPLFFHGEAFFRGFLDRPGGLSEYAAAWLIQHFHFAHRGPWILTLSAWVLFLLTGVLARNVGNTACRTPRFVPPLLLLLLFGQYVFCLPGILALALALAAASGYLATSRRLDGAWTRLLLFACGAAWTYYVAAGPFLLYGVLCAIFELLERRRFVSGAVCLAAAAGVPLLGSLLFGIGLGPAYFRLSGMEAGRGGAATAVFALLNAFFLALVVARSQRRQLEQLADRATRWGKAGEYARAMRCDVVLPVLILAVAGVCIAWRGPDAPIRDALRRNSLARRALWSEFLEELRRRPPDDYDHVLLCDVNRALFETGRLSRDMFAYPQGPGGLFLVGSQGAYVPGACDVLLRLGCVNGAEHTAYEALEIHGERPATLRLLAIVNIVKGRPETAGIYLRILARDVVHGDWAEDCLRRLEADPSLGADAEIRRLRDVMLERDIILSATDEEGILLALLERNGKNRIAFEYLMAHYLIQRRPATLAGQMWRLDDLGYAEFPPVYAEAVLLNARVTERPATIPGRPFPPEIVARVNRVMEIADGARGDRRKIDATMAAEFPESVSRYLVAMPKQETKP